MRIRTVTYFHNLALFDNEQIIIFFFLSVNSIPWEKKIGWGVSTGSGSLNISCPICIEPYKLLIVNYSDFLFDISKYSSS